MNLTLDKMHRFVLPKALRDRLALEPGDEMEVTLEADGIRLRPVRPVAPLTEKDGLLVCSSEVPASVWDTGAFLDRQRDQRSRETSGL